MAHGGKSLLWTGADALHLFILIRVLHITPAVAGGLFVFASFWNALIDTQCARWLDRFPDKRASIAGWMAVIASGSFLLLPCLPPGQPLPAALALLAFRTAFSLIDVPHNAAGATIASVQGHVVVSRWRALLGGAASILIAVTAIPLVQANGLTTGGVRWMLAGVALIAALLLVPLPWLLRAMDKSRPAAHPSVERRGGNWGLAAYCLTQMIGFAALGSVAKAVLHLGTMGLENALLLLCFMRLAAAWLWSPLAGWLGSRVALGCAYALCALSVMLLPIIVSHGEWALTTFGLCLFGFAGGGIALFAWSSLSELVARPDRSGRSLPAAQALGWFTATSKIGLGLSGLLTGAWLSQQSAPTQTSLWSLCGLVSFLCAAVALASIMPQHVFGKAAPTRSDRRSTGDHILLDNAGNAVTAR